MKAGVVIRDITPSCPVHLGGFSASRDRSGLSTHDPLCATVFYLNNGTEQLLWLFCDVIYFNNNDATVLRRRIAQETGVPCENVIISASNTHCAPDYANWDRVHLKDMADPYLHWLMPVYDALTEACLEAKKNTFEASVGFGTASFCEKCLPIMAIRDESTKGPASKVIRGILVNSGLRPAVLSAETSAYSADYVGVLREELSKRFLEAKLGFTLSACDSSSYKENTFEEAARIGSSMGEAVSTAVEGISSFDKNPAIQTAVNYLIPQTKPLVNPPFPQEVMYKYGLPVEIKTIRIGDAAFACISADIVSDSCVLTEALPAKHVFLATLTNGDGIGSLVDNKGFDENSDLARATSFDRGCLPFVESELARLIKQVF